MPNVTIQIMPLGSTAHPGLDGGFGLARFPQPMPDLVHLENASGATYVEGEDAAPFVRAYERIRAAALSVEDSVVRISEWEEGLRK